MNRSTTEIPKDMFKSLKTISLSLAALLLGAGSACGQQSDSYAHKVNTLIGTRGVGLTSGYLYPGATYPFGMVHADLFRQAGRVRHQPVERRRVQPHG